MFNENQIELLVRAASAQLRRTAKAKWLAANKFSTLAQYEMLEFDAFRACLAQEVSI